MKKTLFICVIIIILIIVGDIVFQKKIDEIFDYMTLQLSELDNLDDNELKGQKIEEIENYWKKYSTIFACYIEHAELEKIESQYIIIKAGIDVSDDFFVHEEINRTINIINLIKEKKILRIDNIM